MAFLKFNGNMYAKQIALFASIIIFIYLFLLKDSDNLDKKILDLWSGAKSELTHSLSDLNSSSQELYFLGISSYQIVDYSFKSAKGELIDDLLLLFLKTTPYLVYTDKYQFVYLNYRDRYLTKELTDSYPMWLDKDKREDILASAQFLFTISMAINHIMQIDPKDRTNTMHKFIQNFTPIVESHYRRWVLGTRDKKDNTLLGVLERRGWGCKNNKEEYICNKTLREDIIGLRSNYQGDSYCNSLTDEVMLVYAGLGYYLSSYHHTIQNRELLESFRDAVTLFSQHFKSYTSHDFNGKEIETLGFEEGVWAEHPDFAYSLYSKNSFPPHGSSAINRGVGMDISHAGTVVAFLEMLISCKKELNINFPTDDQMKMFTNRFLYNVFNSDLQNPLFKNYMDGSNGWFRVIPDGSGYAPYNLTSTALIRGYPRLGRFSPKLKEVFGTIRDKLNSDNLKNMEFIQKFYQKTVWSHNYLKNEYDFYGEEIDPHTALFLMNFYSSLI